MFNHLRSFISSLPLNRTTLTIVGLFIILAAIPLTVFLAQQQQEIRKRADYCRSDCDNGYGFCTNTCTSEYNSCVSPCTEVKVICDNDCADRGEPPGCYEGCESNYNSCESGCASTKNECDDGCTAVRNSCYDGCETGNYCVEAGYHACIPGTPAGTCQRDGRTCTAYETYQCNFGGQNYCDTSTCAEPCTSLCDPLLECYQDGQCYPQASYPETNCPDGSVRWVTRLSDAQGNCTYLFDPPTCPSPPPPTPTIRPPVPTPTAPVGWPTPTPTRIPIFTPIPTRPPLLTPTRPPLATPTRPPVLTPTPTRAPTPTLTPTPTPTPRPGDTVLAFSFKLQLVTNPRNTSRQLEVKILDTNNREPKSPSKATGNFQNGKFVGTLNLGSFTSGPYVIKLKVPNTLRRLVENVTNITAGQTNTLKEVEFYSGDLNNDNVLDVVDYANLVGCLELPGKRVVCSDKVAADLNDDGSVTTQDLSILISNRNRRQGD